MTLLLTELSNAGIVMAADSAITSCRNGQVVEVDEEGWTKLLRVPRIYAAVSFWGMIGAVVSRVRFDTWLNSVIANANYSDVSTLAEQIADALNYECGNKPLGAGLDVGIHVAGYSTWTDGVQRPVFYHVHNGHGHYQFSEAKGDGNRLVLVSPKWQSDPRKLFAVHQDFPSTAIPIEANIAILAEGYITRNGAFHIYAVLWNRMKEALDYINLIPNVSIPRDPSDLSSRKGLVHTVLEMMIRLYRCSNQSHVIGGTVTSLGIGPGRYVV